MKRNFLAVIFAVAACIGSLAPASAQVWVQTAPPSPRFQTRPPMPGPGNVWVGGYWRWTGSRYVWVSGRWVRHGGRWCAGTWRHGPRGWWWTDGRWC